MVRKHTKYFVSFLILLLLLLPFFKIRPCDASTNFPKKQSDEKRNQDTPITHLELQSELMTFADKFTSVLGGAYQQFVQKNPKKGTIFIAKEGGIFVMSSAYTIAAGPNPSIALLDMTILVTLGRMIYEDTHLKKFGEDIQLILKPLKILEQDIWRIADKLMTQEEQNKLRKGLIEWKRANPDQKKFSYFRTENFASARNVSNLVKEIDNKGMFGSIKKATTEAERIRLIAERAMYLSTRIPLLFGLFGEVWFQKVITNPELQEVKSDFNRISMTLEQLTQLAESFQKQLINSPEDLILGIKDKEVQNIVGQIQNTVITANSLVKSVNEMLPMTDALLLKLPEQITVLKEFEKNINQIDNTIQNLNMAFLTANQLLTSPYLSKLLDRTSQILGQYDNDAKKLITHLVVSIGGLILFSFICLFVYRYAEKKIINR